MAGGAMNDITFIVVRFNQENVKSLQKLAIWEDGTAGA
jgi:hypothetical protein